MKYYLGNTDWKEWKTILEAKTFQWVNPEAPIYNDDKTLTELSLQLRTLRKVFKRTSTPANVAALNMARIEFKYELRVAASNWTRYRLNEVNKQRHGNRFWIELQKEFPSQKDDMLAPLKSFPMFLSS